MGLDDGYPKNNISRSLVTDEIGVIGVEKGRAFHIMDNKNRASFNMSRVFGNDIEMILQAQSMAVHGKKNSWQSYKNYKIDNDRGKKSQVIRKRSK